MLGDHGDLGTEPNPFPTEIGLKRESDLLSLNWAYILPLKKIILIPKVEQGAGIPWRGRVSGRLEIRVKKLA